MARDASSTSLIGFFVVLVILFTSQLSIADYMYCGKNDAANCPGKDCEVIVYAPPVPGSSNCTTCSERCKGDYNDMYRGSFCYNSHYCFCCFHTIRDEAEYISPTTAPAPGEVAPQTPPHVEPLPSPQVPPVFTLNQDPAISCDEGYTVSTPVGDCSECNERCKSGSFKDDLEGVFCYDTNAGQPFCNCCVRYGSDDVTQVPTPPMWAPPTTPPMVPPVVTPTPPTEAPQIPPCVEPVTAQTPPVMSPDVESAAAPHVQDPHAKKKNGKKHRKISPISPDVKPVAPLVSPEPGKLKKGKDPKINH
ncbi:hypothetical protein MKX03_017246 [Papaver bracteatum]|nr:hypothetical protein MKX03_017246 [Papaver bracteatum]